MKAQVQPPIKARAANRFERQAKDAAHRVGRGETSVARLLTPAPAARFPLPLSRGEALSRPLRRYFEFGFGADLAEVRIHRDRPANAAAREQSARAMTAGSHVFFAQGAYRPDTPRGLELLAHEIAHVLQQTGRRGANGCLAAAPLTGPGALQFVGEEGQEAKPTQEAIDYAIRSERDRILAEAKSKHDQFRDTAVDKGEAVWRGVTFKELLDAHRPAESDDSYSTFCEEVAQDLGLIEADWSKAGWPTPGEDVLQAFETHTIDGYPNDTRFGALFDDNGAGFGFLYDCLKKLGRFGAALLLLQPAPRLKTLHWHGEMHARIDSAEAAGYADPLLGGRSEPAGLIAALERRVNRVAFVPALGVEPLKVTTPDGETGLSGWYDALLPQMIADKTKLGDNELVYAVYAPIVWADKEIEATIKSFFDASAKGPIKGQMDPEGRYKLARNFFVRGGAFNEFEGEKHGYIWSAVDRLIGKALVEVGERGMAYWRAVFEKPAGGFDDLAAKDPVGRGVHDSLQRQARAFFAIENDELPLPGPYLQRIAKWLSVLASDAKPLDAALDGRRRALNVLKLGRVEDMAEDREARFYGLLLRCLFGHIGARLAEYSIDEDAQAAQVLHVEDVRGAHRLRMAAQLIDVADAVGWQDLSAEAEYWLMSRDRKSSHVYLLSDWEPSSAAASAYPMMTEEIGGAIEGWPVSGDALTAVFMLFETRARADALGALLERGSTTDAVPDKQRRPLHREVDRRIAELPLPKRWEVKRYVLSLDPGMIAAATNAAQAAAGTVPPVQDSGTPVADEAAVDETKTPSAAGQPAPTRPPPQVNPTATSDATPAYLRLGELIEAHPKTQRLYENLRSAVPDVGLALPAYDKLKGSIRPFTDKAALPVFVWQIPSLNDVVGVVRFSETLNRRICKANNLDYDTEEAAIWLHGLTNEKWGDEFLKAFDGELDPISAGVAGVQFDVDVKLTKERQRYRELLRGAAVRERTLLVARHLDSLVTTQLTVRVLAPRKALDDLTGFVGGVFPAAQLALDERPELAPPLRPLADLHQTMALLALAEKIKPGIDDALANHNTALIAGYLALVPHAITVADTVLKGTDEASKALVAEALGRDEKVEDFLANRSLLDHLLATLETSRIEHQLKMGFRGKVSQEKSDIDSLREAHPNVAGAIPFVPGGSTVVRLIGADKPNPGFLNGIAHGVKLEEGKELGDVTLVTVLNDFTYIPSFRGEAAGDPTHPGYRKGLVAKGYLESYKARELANRFLNPKTAEQVAPEEIAEKLHDPKTALFELQIAGVSEPRYVTADEVGFLDNFANTVNIGSIIAGLQATAELVEFVMDLTTDVVAMLLGGLGEGGKISAELLGIVQSEEFQTLVENFQKDPKKLVEEVLDTLENKVLDPKFLLGYVLFPQGGLISMLVELARGTGAPKKPTSGTKKKSSFGKVIDALLNLGKHVAGAFQSLHERFQGPMAGLRGSVVSHPRIRWALDLVATYGPMIAVFIGFVARAVDENPNLAKALEQLVLGEPQEGQGKEQDKDEDKGRTVKGLFEHIFSEKGVLDEELGNVMLTLASIELPKEIVPLETLLGAIIDLILKLAKGNAKVKVAAFVANKTGIKDDYIKSVSEQLRSVGADPNRIWSEWLLEEISPKFTELRDESVDGLYEIIHKVLGQLRQGMAELFKEDVPPTPFAYGGPRDKIAVTPVDGNYAAPALDRDSLLPAWQGGTVLSGSAGMPLDAGLRAGAEARFGHDFSHVRLHAGREGGQATDPVRALGLTSGSHVYLHPKVSTTSERGREVLDHELTHVLQQTGARPLGERNDPKPRRGASRRGLKVNRQDESEAKRIAKAAGRRTVQAPLPVTRKTEDEGPAPKFDETLAFDILELVASHRDVVKMTADIDKTTALHKDDPVQTAMADFWKKYIIEGALKNPEAFVSPFGQQRDNILDHLGGKNSEAIKKAVPVIVEQTWLTMKKKKADDPKNKKSETVHEFRTGPFGRVLGAYVFAKTGIAMEINVEITGEKTKPTVEGATAKVHYLNLGRVPVGHKLWTELKWKTKLDDAKQRELAARLVVLDPQPGIWDGKEYAFTSSFVSDVAARSARRTPPKLLSKREYLATGSKDRDGLRLGTHGELTTGASGTKRESHHTTQFLLAQYFHNARTLQKPFDDINFPGVKRAGGALASGRVQAIGIDKPIDIVGTYGDDSGRGEPMPAILIAAESHRQGNLHVQRESKWSNEDETRGSVTQGFAIDNKFRESLPPYLNRLQFKDQSDYQKKMGNVHGVETIAADIHKAAQKTYRWMYSEVMKPALREALPRNELAYYRGLAARDEANIADKTTGALKPAFNLTAGELIAVAAEAERRNKAAMSKFNWVL